MNAVCWVKSTGDWKAVGLSFELSRCMRQTVSESAALVSLSGGDLCSAADDPEALRRLIASGADIEACDEWDCTPLFYAILEGNLDALEVLIQAGANVNAVAGEPGRTILASPPLNLAMQCAHLMDCEKYTPIVKRLEAAGATLGDSAAV